MPKRRCVFTDSLEAEYPFLKEDQQVGKVLCSICKSEFSVGHGGHSDILLHIKKRKHAIAAETKSCSKNVTSYFIKETITYCSRRTVRIPHTKTQPFLSIHGLYILSDKKIA
jgi:hypothetical protein